MALENHTVDLSIFDVLIMIFDLHELYVWKDQRKFL
jgi:hypothetical protein